MVIKAVRDRLADLETTTPGALSPTSSRRFSMTKHDDSTVKRNLLMETLAELYTAQGRPELALEFHLKLGTKNTIDLIREHGLFADVRNQAIALMEFDKLWESKNNAKEAEDADVGEEGKNYTLENAKTIGKNFGSVGSLLGRHWIPRGPAVEMLVSNTDLIPVCCTMNSTQVIQSPPNTLTPLIFVCDVCLSRLQWSSTNYLQNLRFYIYTWMRFSITSPGLAANSTTCRSSCTRNSIAGSCLSF